MKDTYKKVHVYLFDFDLVLGKGSFSKVYKGINLNTSNPFFNVRLISGSKSDRDGVSEHSKVETTPITIDWYFDEDKTREFDQVLLSVK